ncbi:DUF3168 domain-containing protein [Roseovarius indicus]|uniref:Gene transfer agent protein n=1 Tax=Roseovarius indicus TaxID=540747 RepID=A0A0T5P8G5_9RHOB|nr:DUF3168 domain-containing protein [Roseovarius indicus]KRS17531.1 hypothetical protein XM52_13715 [Roseovarius indicus]
MSASEEVQNLIQTTLRADAEVGSIVGDRIYDQAPPGTSRIYPDITFGPSDYAPENLQCLTSREETFQLDCWTRDHGRLASCRVLVDAVKDALHNADLSLSTNALVLIQVEQVRVFRDPDGLTGHGVIQVTASVEEAA